MRRSCISSTDISAICSCYVMTVVMTTDIRVESNGWAVGRTSSDEFCGTPMLLPMCASGVENSPIFLFSAANWSFNEFCSCLLPRFPRLSTRQVHLLSNYASTLFVGSCVGVAVVASGKHPQRATLLYHASQIHHPTRINLPIWKLILLLHPIQSSSNSFLISIQYVFSESTCKSVITQTQPFYTVRWSTTSVQSFAWLCIYG